MSKILGEYTYTNIVMLYVVGKRESLGVQTFWLGFDIPASRIPTISLKKIIVAGQQTKVRARE